MKNLVAYLVGVITKRVDLLLSLTVAVIAMACSTDAGQETAVPPEEGAVAVVIPAATEATAAAVLPVMRPAPTWDNDLWINSETPILLEDLRGKAVLLELSTSG